MFLSRTDYGATLHLIVILEKSTTQKCVFQYNMKITITQCTQQQETKIIQSKYNIYLRAISYENIKEQQMLKVCFTTNHINGQDFPLDESQI